MSQGFVNPYTYATSAPTVTTYTSGSGTYTTPAGVKFLVVEMVGGGGGGSGSGAGAGNGSNGGNTTFGTATANGGNAGLPGGGTGGTASGGTINLQGGMGGFGGGNSVPGALGGSSYFAGGGAGGNNGGGNASNAPANTGAGGGGGGGNVTVQGAYAGGAGGYVQWVISSPSATYSYGVAAGGAGGAAGTSGGIGGNGAAGIIIIYEYYEVLGIPTTLTLPLSVSNGGTGVSNPTVVQAVALGTTQTIAQAATNKITLATEMYDTNNNFSSSTFTASIAGYYYVYGQVTISVPNLACALTTFIYKNGVQFSGADNLTAAVGSTQGFTSANFCQVYLNANDTIELYAYQVNGTSSTLSLVGDGTYLSIYKLV